MPGMRIGLFGGSFDPPHEGHVNLTDMAIRRFQLDRVWWLVTPGNPLKSHGPAPMSARMEMARDILKGDPRVEVTDIEARLNTRLTADVVAAIQRRWPAVHFIWLMGSDNLVQFDRWQRWRDIADRIPIGVIARPGTRLQGRLSRAAQAMSRYRLPEHLAPRLAVTTPPAWVLINVPMSPLSSSAIRAADGRRMSAPSLANGRAPLLTER
ncbi:MAG: nicotinic acid mononucleotide adenylyltransferase [Paracoccus denitrificans]|nr:MAG: nicotinic acid mononucleotide adenylyltransferase [Paracoccus denitrificans]PZO84502.1 MAG: nicotinic acid mononucleotide adenylyltransferase [Paracoccus denitrificans]